MRDDTIRKVSVIVSAIICVMVGGFLAKIAFDTVTTDRAFKGVSEDGGAVTLNRKDPVLKILGDIHLSRITSAMDSMRTIRHDGSLPLGIKSYFSDFEEFYKYAIEKTEDYTTPLTTETFIRNAITIKEYFSRDSKDDNLSKASIIPYFFIKNYNATNKKQKNERATYKAYIDNFVVGRASLDNQAANVICLYVYASYHAGSRPKDYESLKAEIANFIEAYPQNLGENGDMSIQRTYLINAQELLRKRPKGKGLPWGRLQPYISSNL